MTARIAFDVAGLPVPQGNLRAGLIAGKARVIHSGPKFGPLHAWREAIATEARAAHVRDELLTEAVGVNLTFRMPRPQSHYTPRGPLRPSAPVFPAGRVGDIDKLARAVLDAVTGVLIADDAQVVELVARKVYVDRWVQPGVAVEVSERLP